MKVQYACRVTAMLAILSYATACNPYEQVEKDRRAYSSIAAERPIGSECGPEDSASIKRRNTHPLGPTGGWYGRNEIDTSRTSERSDNRIERFSGGFGGYLKFERSGRLQARSYDDVYGAVYCGFAPATVPLEPSDKAVWVRLADCSVGDGGLDQVHEVCWFEGESKSGRVIFSTAQQPEGEPYRAVELFRSSDLGHEMFFNERVAFSVIVESVKSGDYETAVATAQDSVRLISDMRPGQMLGTEIEVPPQAMQQDAWVKLQQFLLGSEVGTEEFAKRLRQLQHDLKPSVLNSRCFECEYFEKIIPFARWLDAALAGRQTALPDESEIAMSIVGRDPRDILPILRGEASSAKAGPEAGYQFWIAAKHVVAAQPEAAETALARYLEQVRENELTFELGAALAMKQQLAAE